MLLLRGANIPDVGGDEGLTIHADIPGFFFDF